MRFDASVNNDATKTLYMITSYNNYKTFVDIMYPIVRSYTAQRCTQRQLSPLFFNILTLLKQQILSEKTNQRRILSSAEWEIGKPYYWKLWIRNYRYSKNCDWEYARITASSFSCSWRASAILRWYWYRKNYWFLSYLLQTNYQKVQEKHQAFVW